MTNLELVLAGRDERAAAQNELLASASFVCQIALNVPGWPKRLKGDEAAARRCAAEFLKRCGLTPLAVRELANGAGFCLRPGFGYPLDPWRVEQMAALLPEWLQFSREERVRREWWVFWRRLDRLATRARR